MEDLQGKSWEIYIMILSQFYTNITGPKSESNEYLLISQECSLFPNSTEEQENLKEEDEGFEVFNQDVVDSSYIRYGFLLLQLLYQSVPFKISFQELQF